jgi:hypothetical protein
MTEFLAYIPPDPQVIVFAGYGEPGPRISGFDLMKFLPEYSRSVNDPDLPGWIEYAKAP